jgi:magnesium transporter
VAREVHPGQVGWSDRERPSRRELPRFTLFDSTGRRIENPPLTGVGREVFERGAFFYADGHAPADSDLDALAREFGLHPLAIEDVRSRHQRPKIDIYGNQYFLVFYRIAATAGRPGIRFDEIDFFIGSGFLLVFHDAPVPLLSQTVERFCRLAEKRDVPGLLYEILDAIVDEYFPTMDRVAERAEEIETSIFQKFERQRLEALLALKRDLAILRRIVGPERDAINVLLRRDPPVIDPARIVYYQDVYDHLIRIVESIDTYRDILAGTLDAFLTIENNRLSDVVRKLTVVSTIFLPLTFITGFFGMNFEKTTGTGDLLFFATFAVITLLPFGVLALLRRLGVR